MNNRLVNPSEPFNVIYSLYHHEYFGCLVSSHVVPLMPNGQLSYAHQGLNPDNIEQFACKIDDIDRKIVKLTASINPRAIIKKLRGDPRKEHEFFSKKYTGEVKKSAFRHIQRHMAEILPLMEDRALYTMANDSYPAQSKINFSSDKAGILFHFKRQDDHTKYYPTLKLRDEKIEFMFKDAVLPCLQPAWMLLNDELFTFKEEVDGRKLKPFLNKRFIAIPKAKEEEYYGKFITQLVEKHSVYARGFEIETVRAQPEFTLAVNTPDAETFSFSPQVKYDRFTLKLKDAGRIKAVMENRDDNFTFYRVKRDERQEDKVRGLLDDIKPNPGSLHPWEYIDRETGLAWLATNSHKLENLGVEIVQQSADYRINLHKPEITLSTEENGDWFDVKAVVQIGKFSIPFIKFRKHILSGKREYKLPDETICILPDNWFSDFQHLLEVAKSDDDGTMKVKKYQASLLNMPSSGHGQREEFMKVLNGKKEMPKIPIPQHLKAELRSYQQEGFEWLCFLKDHGIGAILADDMGLGKTLQTLALLQHEKETGNTVPSLIILPTSLIHNWQREAQKFTPNLQVYIHTGVGRSKELEVFEGQDLILTTYGIVRQDIDILKDFPFHYAILDESQMIKNPSSKTAKAVKKLISRHRLSLTGTPIENTVLDIWSQMAFLNPGLLGTEAFFKRYYVTPIEKNKDPIRTAKLRRIIYPFILRRKKRQVEKDLPPKVENLHFCGMAPEQEAFYEETRSQYRNYLLKLVNTGAYKKNKLNLLTGLQKLRQIAIHPQLIDKEKYELKQSGKYLEVKRMLMRVLGKKGKSKVLIFSQFVKMLTLLREDLDAEGITYNYLDGGTRDRQAQVDSFQDEKDIRVFLISLKAGGVGLNLTAADYVFILDPWWNPAVENQAVDRSHRIGQQRTVFYFKFITKDTIEEKILNLQRRKEKLSDDIITLEEDIYKTMTEQDLEELLG